MMLDKLGKGLQSAIEKIMNAKRIDAALVNDIVKDIQRALLEADVNVKLVFSLSNSIKKRSLENKPPAGMTQKAYILTIVYEELRGILGENVRLELKPQKIMMVGLQGSGKTTTTVKLAKYFQRKGLKPYVIGADTFRPAAYEQLSVLCDGVGIPLYGEPGEKNATKIVRNGLQDAKNYDVLIVDTTGRHALENDLIEEMKQIHAILHPDKTFLVLDAAIGQGASMQSEAFNKAVGVDGIIITKLDGTAKGGGALSAVAETGSPITFIGTGERIDDLEPFDTSRFISRLLGMGDLQSLMERAKEINVDEAKAEKMLKGRFTLKDFYEQLESMTKLGPLKQIMQMLPGMGIGIKMTDSDYEMTTEKINGFKVIMSSMSEDELMNPKIINAGRIKRVAIGSGSSIEEVRGLLKYYRMTQKAMKGLSGRQNISRLMKKFGE